MGKMRSTTSKLIVFGINVFSREPGSWKVNVASEAHRLQKNDQLVVGPSLIPLFAFELFFENHT